MTRTDLTIVAHTPPYPQNSKVPTLAHPLSASRTTSPVSADKVYALVPPYSHTSVQPAVDTPFAVTVTDTSVGVAAAAAAVAGTVVEGTAAVGRTDTRGDSRYCS